jgi:hypothetical protein
MNTLLYTDMDTLFSEETKKIVISADFVVLSPSAQSKHPKDSALFLIIMSSLSINTVTSSLFQ